MKNGGYQKEGYIASFLGFVPARNPKLVIYVALDEPAGKSYHGGTVAGPVFSAIAGQSLSYMGVFPDNPMAGAVAKKASPGFTLASATSAGLELLKEGSRPQPGQSQRQSRSHRLRTGKTQGGSLEAVLPDLKGKSMRTVLAAAKNIGVEVEFRGSGMSYNQKPAPGKSVSEGDSVVVWFR